MIITKSIKSTIQLFFVGFFLTSPLFAQNDFANETIVGINFNTNGGLIGGAFIRHSKILSETKNLNFGIEITNVKHPGEKQETFTNGNSYILGKKNYLIAFRTQVGLEKELFRKGDEDGVRLSFIGNIGPTLGIVKPYYILFNENGITKVVPYDEKKHEFALYGNFIEGGAGFFQGFEGTKIVPGFHGKFGINFEFGAHEGNLSGIETGILLEAYPSKIELVEYSASYPTYNKSLFSSLYISIYFGGRR